MLLPSSSLQVLWQFSCTPVTYASISPHTPHTHSLCSLLLKVPPDCASGPLLHPASDQKQTRNYWVDLCLPRVSGDVYLLKTLGIQSYLIPHLILLGNDMIWGLLSMIWGKLSIFVNVADLRLQTCLGCRYWCKQIPVVDTNCLVWH